MTQDGPKMSEDPPKMYPGSGIIAKIGFTMVADVPKMVLDGTRWLQMTEDRA